MTLDEIDKIGLIAESYRIEGIDIAQCRSIFLDWALKLPDTIDQKLAVAFMVTTYAIPTPNHPMSLVLKEGTSSALRTGRRGGRASRVIGPISSDNGDH